MVSQPTIVRLTKNSPGLDGGIMTKALALVFAVALAGSAIASEEEAVQLKIYVDGKS